MPSHALAPAQEHAVVDLAHRRLVAVAEAQELDDRRHNLPLRARKFQLSELCVPLDPVGPVCFSGPGPSEHVVLTRVYSRQ